MTSTKIALKNIKDIDLTGLEDGNVLGYDSSLGIFTPTMPVPPNITILDIEGNKTLEASDANTMQRITVAPTTITVPPDSEVDFDTGTAVLVYGKGSGTVTILPGDGVTINNEQGLVLFSRYSMATIVKEGDNEWVAFGSLGSA